jgi:hypothetical protein
MKYTLILAGIAVLGTNAQKCEKTTDIKKERDPLLPFKPKSATFPCDMGSPIPLGKVPTGCAKFEIIVGEYYPFAFENRQDRSTHEPSARGTSEPGNLGMVVGDPVVARVKRDMPGVEVRGYPVQVILPLLSKLR